MRSPFAGTGAAYGWVPLPCQGARLDGGQISPHRPRVTKQPPSPAELDRERRLAEALRANLRKRKAKAREAKVETPDRT